MNVALFGPRFSYCCFLLLLSIEIDVAGNWFKQPTLTQKISHYDNKCTQTDGLILYLLNSRSLNPLIFQRKGLDFSPGLKV